MPRENLPPELANVSPAALEAVLLLLRQQQQEEADRQTGILQPNQIRGVKKNYQYKYQEYPKALTPPPIEVANAHEERRNRTKWNMPLPWDARDPMQQEYIRDYYALREYPVTMQPPQVIAQDANHEAAIRAQWQAEFGIEAIKLYPAWKFHSSKPPVQVADAKAEELLGPGWYDTPQEAMDAIKATPKPPTKTQDELDREALIELAGQLGIKIDAREKTPTIRKKVSDAQEKLAETMAEEI